jgi:hypothetical protein
MPKQEDRLARPLADQHTAHNAESNPPKPKPQRVDLTPEEPRNIGYVGGVRVSK